MQSLMRIFSFLIFISPFYTTRALSQETVSQVNVNEVKERLGIVEGEYELVEGSRELCISGNYEVRPGVNTLSLFADGGVFAAHIHRERLITNERGCSNNYSTRAISDGFENREEVHCPAERISYVRIMNAKFKNGELTYTMQTLRVFENKKSKTTCKLKRKNEERTVENANE